MIFLRGDFGLVVVSLFTGGERALISRSRTSQRLALFIAAARAPLPSTHLALGLVAALLMKFSTYTAALAPFRIEQLVFRCVRMPISAHLPRICRTKYMACQPGPCSSSGNPIYGSFTHTIGGGKVLMCLT
jgi:hypothetical protein